MPLYLLAAALVPRHASGQQQAPQSSDPFMVKALEERCRWNQAPEVLSPECNALVRLAQNCGGESEKQPLRDLAIRVLREAKEQYANFRRDRTAIGSLLKAGTLIKHSVRFDPQVSLPELPNSLRQVLTDAGSQPKAERTPAERLDDLDSLYKLLEGWKPGVQWMASELVALQKVPEADQIQVAMRLGIVRLKQSETEQAKEAFRKAVIGVRELSLPPYSSDEARNLFAAIKRELLTPPSCPTCPPLPQPASLTDSQRLGLLSGGVGLAAAVGGVAAGWYALGVHQAERVAANAGDNTAYMARRDEAWAWARGADIMYIVGAAGLAAGAYLFFSGAPAKGPSVSLSVSPESNWVYLNGRF